MNEVSKKAAAFALAMLVLFVPVLATAQVFVYPSRGQSPPQEVGGAIGGDAGKGAAVGAAVGGLFGLMRRARRTEEEQQQQQSYMAQQQSALAQGHAADNRAFSTCMTGRGYAVSM